MALAVQLANDVDPGVRSRGQAYFSRGVVHIEEGNPWSVDATVRGTSLYDVYLTRNKKVVKASCSCDYFQSNLQSCKHIWATILAADARGLLRGSGGNGPLRLIEDEEGILDDEDPDGWEDPDEWDDDDDDEGDPWQPRRPSRSYRSPPPPPRPRPKQTKKKKAPRPPEWQQHLAGLRGAMEKANPPRKESWTPGREILYLIDVATTKAGQGFTVEVLYRDRKQNGEWSKPRSQRVPLDQIPRLPDPADREIMALLVGAKEQPAYWTGYYNPYSSWDSAPVRYVLSEPIRDVLVPQMCRTGRCFLRLKPKDDDLKPVRWDEGAPWELWLSVVPIKSGRQYQIAGSLRRGEERLDLASPLMIVAGGMIFWEDRVARLQDFGAFNWLEVLRKHGSLTVPVKQKDEFLKELLHLPHLPRLDLPEELRYEEVTLTPRPRLMVRAAEKGTYGYGYGHGSGRLRGELSFGYGDGIVNADEPGRGVYQPEQRRLVLRDAAAEQEAAARLHQLGFRPAKGYGNTGGLELAPGNLPRVVKTLLDSGWHVEAEGKLYRQPGNIHIEVNSGIDWFELHGSVEFGESTAQLPELLAALKRGETTVRLDDGTFGMLPEEWLKKYGLLAGLGTAEGDHLRFSRTQAGLLDALLASQPEATCDETFARMRDELRSFEGIKAADPPSGFTGELRAYQRDGLGWLHFLRKFGFGGCLADDMGLGKTVQVLALLESRRELRANPSPEANGATERPGPSLVVVPRSLVFNWKQEAARFTPKLRVLDHTGMARMKPGEHFNDYDVVLTTYGTLRRDAIEFKDRVFDYCILDESQAIKNANTDSAKAARLLRAHHRLAMSGTPVENHLGELWSLFEFLNPGMLGSASVFKLGGVSARNPSEETRSLLARALRPFILRRKKEQVASDLPQKLEQTLYCEMEPAQRKRYDELREHYRRELLGKIERDGINKSKIMILEALLRLRQAACHPGLVNKSLVGEPSAKLDLLLPQVAEVLEEGHKVLVFSQFTSLLAIVRDRLDREGIAYEYLDGRTRNRAEKVEHFQNDPTCKLFLISLKAGGLGLNLTAAEYVFLLDPWWNPAVEAQAIDRAHRIGQTKPVFAYRLIARDTVEEKVLQLQESKRSLADAIINADNSLIRNLGREDLELLLS